MDIIDWIGFVGVFQILLAYILNVRNIVTKKDLSFILLNLIGASLACLASVLMNYWPFILLEGIWAFVSLLSLFSYFKKVWSFWIKTKPLWLKKTSILKRGSSYYAAL